MATKEQLELQLLQADNELFYAKKQLREAKTAAREAHLTKDGLLTYFDLTEAAFQSILAKDKYLKLEQTYQKLIEPDQPVQAEGNLAPVQTEVKPSDKGILGANPPVELFQLQTKQPKPDHPQTDHRPSLFSNRGRWLVAAGLVTPFVPAAVGATGLGHQNSEFVRPVESFDQFQEVNLVLPSTSLSPELVASIQNRSLQDVDSLNISQMSFAAPASLEKAADPNWSLGDTGYFIDPKGSDVMWEQQYYDELSTNPWEQEADKRRGIKDPQEFIKHIVYLRRNTISELEKLLVSEGQMTPQQAHNLLGAGKQFRMYARNPEASSPTDTNNRFHDGILSSIVELSDIKETNFRLDPGIVKPVNRETAIVWLAITDTGEVEINFGDCINPMEKYTPPPPPPPPAPRAVPRIYTAPPKVVPQTCPPGTVMTKEGTLQLPPICEVPAPAPTETPPTATLLPSPTATSAPAAPSGPAPTATPWPSTNIEFSPTPTSVPSSPETPTVGPTAPPEFRSPTPVPAESPTTVPPTPTRSVETPVPPTVVPTVPPTFRSPTPAPAESPTTVPPTPLPRVETPPSVPPTAVPTTPAEFHPPTPVHAEPKTDVPPTPVPKVDPPKAAPQVNATPKPDTKPAFTGPTPVAPSKDVSKPAAASSPAAKH